MRKSLLFLALLATTAVLAQTQVTFSHIRIIEKGDSLSAPDVTVQLKGDEGSDRTVIYSANGIEAKTWVKVSTHNVRRSSLKDSAVNLIFEIDLRADKDKDNKRVEKIFYLDQARTANVSQRFNFKNGITMRGITLSFDCTIQ
ncbi:MAG TPA: hypothetical protein VHL57_05020 [Flavobacteriales bacterium]|nr:hypothetical protein [Flavobacteriales bacterium]